MEQKGIPGRACISEETQRVGVGDGVALMSQACSTWKSVRRPRQHIGAPHIQGHVCVCLKGPKSRAFAQGHSDTLGGDGASP